MEVRSLLGILLRKWWLIVPIFLIGFGSTLVFTFSQPRVYESTTTMIVTPSGAFADDVLSAVATLSRQPEIAETYAQIANSQTIRRDAIEALELNVQQRADVRLASRLVPGTNILEVSVRSTDPELAQGYADAIRDALVEYTGGLNNIFELQVLDVANIAQIPVEPNIPLNAAAGAIASLALAVGAGLASELLAPPARRRPEFEMLDQDSLAYSEPFFMLRLRQEMSRARRSGTTIVAALINVGRGSVFESATPRSRRDALRRLGGLLDSHLRTEDIVARVDNHVFAVLLPDTAETEAVPMIEALRHRVALPVVGEHAGEAIHAQPAAGLVQYAGESITAEELLDRARHALRDAEAIPVGATQTFSTLRPHVSG